MPARADAAIEASKGHARMHRNTFRTASRLGLALTLVSTAVAGAVAHATSAPLHSYTADEFGRYAPRTALDMLRQVPGFVIREAEQERGLGQASGNVLLNGQRISGKGNDVLSELGRVPASTVLRIELLDAATLDIPGLSGQVANVVVQARGLSGQWAWRPEFRSYYTDPLLTRGEASVSSQRGAIEYTLGLNNSAGNSGAGGPTWIYNADNSLRETRDDTWTGKYNAPRLSARLSRALAGGNTSNLNASYQRVHYDYVETGRRTGPGLPDRSREVAVSERGYSHELGGDHSFALGVGALKLIGLHRAAHRPVEEQVRVRRDDGSAPDTGSRFAREADEREAIARGEYRWKAAGGDWQISAEGAFNSLDADTGLWLLEADGSFQPRPLPGASDSVKEDRYELIGSYGRPVATGLTLQLAAGAEHSVLRQTGGDGQSRSFLRPKGQLSLAWTPNASFDLNARLQRRVGQLNFYDFLATVNLTDDRANSGNPDLVPPQSWELEMEANRKLGAWGSTSVRVYTHRIDDIVDIVPIGDTGQSPGNIDRATRQGAEWKGSIKLDPIGWGGARVDARWWLQDSRVRDPLTGENRRIGNSLIRFAQLTLRHDVAGTDWAWGSSGNHELNSRDVRLTEEGRRWEGPVWANVFIEHKNIAGLTVRATAGNQLDAMSMWDRTVHTGRRDSAIDYYERRDRRIGPVFSFVVSGKF